jgi:hypothetical protein
MYGCNLNLRFQTRKRAWQNGGVHVCRYFVGEILGEIAECVRNLLNAVSVLFTAKRVYCGVLEYRLAAKGA